MCARYEAPNGSLARCAHFLSLFLPAVFFVPRRRKLWFLQAGLLPFSRPSVQSGGQTHALTNPLQIPHPYLEHPYQITQITPPYSSAAGSAARATSQTTPPP